MNLILELINRKRLAMHDATGLTLAEVPEALRRAEALEQEGREMRLTITDFMLASAGADPTNGLASAYLGRSPTPNDVAPVLLTLAQTAKILGIAVGTLRNRCADGRFN